MLEARDIEVHYGRHQALNGVSLEIAKGEIVVVLGANGAGKSTMLRAIAGLVPKSPVSRVHLDGAEISSFPAHDIVEAGIALVPEGRGIFGDLRVEENLILGANPKRARANEKENFERVYSLFPVLAERRRQIARTMSGGEQQMVAIGRAMMSAPDILLLDEPSLGLSPILCGELFRSLSNVRDTGIGVLLVEQNARRSLEISDRGYLLENGRIVSTDTAAALAEDERVQAAYLGKA